MVVIIDSFISPGNAPIMRLWQSVWLYNCAVVSHLSKFKFSLLIFLELLVIFSCSALFHVKTSNQFQFLLQGFWPFSVVRLTFSLVVLRFNNSIIIIMTKSRKFLLHATFFHLIKNRTTIFFWWPRSQSMFFPLKNQDFVFSYV